MMVASLYSRRVVVIFGRVGATPSTRMSLSTVAWPNSAVVSTSFVADNLGRVALLDGSWYMPAQQKDGRKEWMQQRIAGAQHFDINAPGLCDVTTTLPHMLPSEEAFAAAIAKLGVSHDKPVVVYDGAGLFSAARVWWTLTAFGHKQVAVLSGGLPRWLAEGRPVERTEPEPGRETPVEKWTLNTNLVRNLAQVQAATAARRACSGSDIRHAELVVDARAAGRFDGSAPEPRVGLSSGHVPMARSLPFTAVLDATKHNELLPKETLVEVFKSAGVDVERPGPIVTTCGSGVTAAVLYLALVQAGRSIDGTAAGGRGGATALYDGAWTEYASQPGTEIAKGPAEDVPAERL